MMLVLLFGMKYVNSNMLMHHYSFNIFFFEKDGTLVNRMQVHLKEVKCIITLGRLIVSGSVDSSLIIWDTKVSNINFNS